ncbi:type-F conjugative transfer system mating-pair stabilization protein TraN [Klebsiella pneumoniae]|nr:type-F conjugative transfer system mating-pair stabilization protein TraN [Klebsiella pneumoniae]
MKDRPYFIALPEIVRVEMKTVISVLTAHFLSLAPSSGWHPPPALTVEVPIKPVRILRNRCRAMV